jgi:sigma-B regulation protein RsbU (phosphoserine phosphatase)
MNETPRILIVDDAPENLQVLMAALKDDYALLAATSGERALELAAKEPRPDLVLLDVIMPGLSGYEVCERLRDDPATAGIPVVFVTSLTEAGDEARGLALGAVDYITKPFNATLVKARVRNHLELKRYRDDLEATVEARTRELLRTTAEKEKLESELRVARTLQMSMVPHGRASGPNGEYEIDAVLEPAKAVGGDLYDHFLLEDGRLCFVVGDVSDKGVPAALFMVKTGTLIRTESVRQTSPVEILGRVNAELCRDNDECMFVTLALGILDLASGRVAFASAGHEPPLLTVPGEGTEFVTVAGGPALGLDPGADFVAEEIALAPGSRIVLYTDGVTEAFDAAGEPFGPERLREAVSGHGAGEARGLPAAVLDGIGRFVGDAPQSDDITVFGLGYGGAGGGA